MPAAVCLIFLDSSSIFSQSFISAASVIPPSPLLDADLVRGRDIGLLENIRIKITVLSILWDGKAWGQENTKMTLSVEILQSVRKLVSGHAEIWAYCMTYVYKQWK